MKAAIYLTEGLEQIVLTPETDLEKSVLDKIHFSDIRELSIHQGGFYECRGGWIREADEVQAAKDSTIFVLKAKK